MAVPSREISEPAENDAGATIPDGAHTPKRSRLDGFRRITTSGEVIPEIDGLRFIAIAAVILHHLALFVSTQRKSEEGLLLVGQNGVELFFAISGFILAVPFAMQYLNASKRVKLSRYFLRRFTRLEPPYLLSLLLLFAMRVWLRGQPFDVYRWNLLWSSFYVHGFVMGVQSQINGVAWSLEIEIQFYLLMPLLASIFLVKHRWVRRAILLIVAALAMSIQPVVVPGLWHGWQMDEGKLVQHRFYLERHLLNYIQYFLVGLLLADVYVTEWRGVPPALRTRVGWGDFAWLIGWPVLVWLLHHGGVGNPRGGLCPRVLFPIIIFLLYVGLFHSLYARRLMRIPILTILGGMCYSIYLMHNSVIQFFGPYVQRFLPQNYALAVLIFGLMMVPLILLLCGLYFRLIERPCMRPDWPRRVWRWFSSRLFVEEQEPSQTP
jgi:peptidoglycan/LPS O-acetylase OafA/YrhL